MCNPLTTSALPESMKEQVAAVLRSGYKNQSCDSDKKLDLERPVVRLNTEYAGHIVRAKRTSRA